MDISGLIRELWDKFKALLEGKRPEPESAVFSRIPEAGSWRLGVGLWSGRLSVFQKRIYYLEVNRTSLADRRELNIKPPPSHTFKLYYFRQVEGQNLRTTVFVVYLNCFMRGNSEDFIAVEMIGKAAANHLLELSQRSYVGSSDKTQAEVIKPAGQLPILRLKEGNQGLPAVILLGQATLITSTYWRDFFEAQIQSIKEEEDTRAKRRGFG